MFKYVGNMHGNEAVGREILIFLMQYILENYHRDDRVTQIVDSTNIFIMPTMNPDGHQLTGYDSASPDDAVFRLLAHTYANHHKTMAQGNLCPLDYFPGGITNGAHWYDVPGGMEDYNYLNSNCFEITVELSCCKYPPRSQLATEWDNNKDALLSYLEMVHVGVHGFVKDDQTGAGIPNATISVVGINHNVTSAQFGDYWRLLVPGKYSVRASAHGYEPLTHTDVVVPDGKQGVELEFRLQRMIALGILKTGPISDYPTLSLNNLCQNRSLEN
nr:hypothetical protein BaRGS_002427 [Batillaria attramentaria]